MKSSDIREQFRKEKDQPIFTVSKLDVNISNEYVCWLESKVIELSVCNYCKGSGWDSYPNHDTTPRPCPECQP